MPAFTLVLPIQRGRGGVAGEVAGIVGMAGSVLHLTGTRGGRTINPNLLKEVKYA